MGPHFRLLRVVLAAVFVGLIGFGSLPIAHAAAACTVVELYPGYPGYRGFIMGLNGASDYDCLEHLRTEDPRFSKPATDRENRQIAADLGIDGPMDQWVWENWLAIEARRGPVTTCYACALAANPRPPSPVEGTVRPTDVRLRSGLPGQSTLVRQWMRDRGLSTFYAPLPDDYQLRVLVGLNNPGQYLTAPEIIDAAEQVLDQLTTPGAASPDVHALWGNVLKEGGYFPVPRTARPEDQILGFELSGYGLAVLISAEGAAALQSWMKQLFASWQDYLLRGGQHSLRVYAKSVGAERWI